MDMTASEIYRDIKLSLYPKKQMKILAELNDTSENEIKKIYEAEKKKDPNPLEIDKPKRSYTKPEHKTSDTIEDVLTKVRKPKERKVEDSKLPGTIIEALNHELSALQAMIYDHEIAISKITAKKLEITEFLKKNA